MCVPCMKKNDKLYERPKKTWEEVARPLVLRWDNYVLYSYPFCSEQGIDLMSSKVLIELLGKIL